MFNPNLAKPRLCSIKNNILRNEKYCGDVLQQKTFVNDCISRKHIRNVGQLPMYLTQDHHEGIVSRDTFNAARAEFARRGSGRAPSQKAAPTGRSCYSAKYALTGILVCGECGTLYRRCVWSKGGRKKAVWRCASRIDYARKYCHDSPTLDEKPLQKAILAAINSVMSRKVALVEQITDAMRMELASVPGEGMSLSDINRKLEELNQEFQALFNASKTSGGFLQYTNTFKHITEEMARLKDQKTLVLEQQQNSSAANRRIQDAVSILNAGSAEIEEWDEKMIRQLVDTVKVLSADRIRVYLRGGMEIEQAVRK